MKLALTVKPKQETAAWRVGRKLLLLCGLLSSVVYVGADIASAQRWMGYHYADQAVSELMALEAPTRPFLAPLFLAYDLLVMAFALGLTESAGENRPLRATGWLLFWYGVAGLLGLLVFPMHSRGTSSSMTPTDIGHICVTGIVVVLILLFTGFGAAARGKWFRLYSILTLLLVLGFGIWTSFDARHMADQLPTPGFGIKERINIYSTMLWVAVLSLDLLWDQTREKSRGWRR